MGVFQFILALALAKVNALQVLPQGLDGQVEIPALGRPFALGSFYDVRRDQVVAPGRSLWDQDKIQNRKLQINKGAQASFWSEASFSDRVSRFGMSPGLTVSFLSGLVEVQGSASCLKSKPISKKEVATDINLENVYYTEILPIGELEESIQYPSLFDELQDATHLVVAIDYGANAIFQFKKEWRLSEDVWGDFMEAVGLLDKERSALTEKQKKNLDSITCEFYSDVFQWYPPMSWYELSHIHQDLNHKMTRNNSIPVRIHLSPLARMDSRGYRPLREISWDPLWDVIRVMKDYRTLAIEMGKLPQTKTYGKLSYFKRHVDDFIGNTETLIEQFRADLAHLLPKIRGKSADEATLVELTLKMSDKIDWLNQWVEQKQVEAVVLDDDLIAYSPNAWVTEPGQFDKLLHDGKNKYILALNLGLYFKEDTSIDCIIKENCTEKEKQIPSWLKSSFRAKFRAKNNMFYGFLMNNEWNKPEGTVFVIKENLNIKDEQDMELNYYTDQELVERDLEQLPSIKNIRVKDETCSLTKVEWEKDMDSSYLKGFHLLWKSTEAKGWGEMKVTETRAAIPTGGFDLDLIIQTALEFGNGHQNFTFHHSTSLSDCH